MQPDSSAQTLMGEQDDTPTVSIGMPVYNGAREIRRALDSLLAQSFTDLELIISDNASEDGTETICREYAARDPRIRYYRQERNVGAFHNFQFVLDHSRGRFFMWASHDDLWMPAFVASTLDVLERNNDAACAVPRIEFDPGGISHATFAITGTPRQRLRAVTTRPGDNCWIYGLHRTTMLKRALSRMDWDVWAGDWLVVAAAAIEGEILEVPQVLMARRAKDQDFYLSTLSHSKPLFVCFPLLPYSLRLLHFKEARDIGVLRNLLRLNLSYHVQMARVRGWYAYRLYRAIYRALRKTRRVITLTGFREVERQ